MGIFDFFTKKAEQRGYNLGVADGYDKAREEWSNLPIRNLSVEKGELTLLLEDSQKFSLVFANHMATMLKEFDAKNYLEMQFPDNRSGETFILTFLRKSGKTPHQQKEEALKIAEAAEKATKAAQFRLTEAEASLVVTQNVINTQNEELTDLRNTNRDLSDWLQLEKEKNEELKKIVLAHTQKTDQRLAELRLQAAEVGKTMVDFLEEKVKEAEPAPPKKRRPRKKYSK